MRATRYRRHRITSPDLLVYTRLMAEDNGAELLRLRHALGHALREEVTRRQRQGPSNSASKMPWEEPKASAPSRTIRLCTPPIKLALVAAAAV